MTDRNSLSTLAPNKQKTNQQHISILSAIANHSTKNAKNQIIKENSTMF